MNLHSIKALVTRPRDQAEDLAKAIEFRQGEAWIHPLLEIKHIEETQSMRNRVLSLDLFDQVIVTSVNAAYYGLELIERYWPQLPIGLAWHAVGPKTANKLSEYDINASFSEKGIDSEALLSLKSLAEVNNQKILIIKGKKGRQLIKKTLQKRGAAIECLDVYERTAPNYPPDKLPAMLAAHPINVILCTSGESLANLIEALPASYPLSLALVVPSERIARQAKTLGFSHVTVANGASNEAMLNALGQIEAIISNC